ncbi:MAG: beta-ketoacyl-ACP synthase II [Nanoarchaeota archaeon]|nr:beta-ketoacyl-ACP synthase II [Nanoarchaeota archaeon]
MTNRRVVVTGMGVVTPLGRNKEELFENLLNGRTDVRNLTSEFPWMNDCSVQIGSAFGPGSMNGEFQFDFEQLGIPKKDIKKLGRHTQYSLAAAHEAVSDLGILERGSLRDRTGVCIGVGFGGIREIEDEKQSQLERGIRKVSPLFVSRVIPDAPSGWISKVYGFHATDSPSLNSACETGISAITFGYDKIKLGYADVMITGGAESPFGQLPFGCFARMGATTSSFNDNPREASRPFDRDRSGFVMSEGAGILVLEELVHAKRRGAKIYGELLGYGTSTDACHETHPDPTARFTTRAIELAIRNSGIKPEQVGYINCHGTSTYDNDALESLAIKNAFILGGNAYKLALNSTKSLTGHCMGAAGAIEAIVTLLTISTGLIHKTANLQNPDSRPYEYKSENGDIVRNPRAICDLDYTTETMKKEVNYALSNGFGFYGHNGCLCLARFRR